MPNQTKTHMCKTKNKPNQNQNQPTKLYSPNKTKPKPKQTKPNNNNHHQNCQGTRDAPLYQNWNKFKNAHWSGLLFLHKMKMCQKLLKVHEGINLWFMWKELKWQSLINASYRYWAWLAEAHKGCCGWKSGATDSPVCCSTASSCLSINIGSIFRNAPCYSFHSSIQIYLFSVDLLAELEELFSPVTAKVTDLWRCCSILFNVFWLETELL